MKILWKCQPFKTGYGVEVTIDLGKPPIIGQCYIVDSEKALALAMRQMMRWVADVKAGVERRDRQEAC